MEEIWKDIKGFEGYYKISNLGKVKSLNRIGVDKRGRIYHVKENIRKLTKDKNGYLRITLKKDGEIFFALVHRLIAEAFIPNPMNLPIINHKDENPSNNSIDNLEWCTYAYNNTYNDVHLRKGDTFKENYKNGNYNLFSPNKIKQVVQLSKSNEFIKIWDLMMDIEKELKIKSGHISECCNNKRKSAGGFNWMYAEDFLKLNPVMPIHTDDFTNLTAQCSSTFECQ